MSRQQPPPFRRSQSTPVQTPDLYQQLIESSDLVKELDDIEAISQQISQHAEVLYQTWKNNGISPGPFKLPTKPTTASPTSPMPTSPQPGSSSQPMSHVPNGGSHHLTSASTNSNTFPRRGFNLETNGHGANPYYRQNGGSEFMAGSGRLSPDPYRVGSTTMPRSSTSPSPSSAPSSINRLKPLTINSGPTPSSMSGLSSPSFISSASSPPGGSYNSNGDKNPVVEKSLDLLAAPEVNGSLKELVSSFVSTDRAKQAARQTIANTINNMTKRTNGGFRSGSPSAASTSTSSAFSSRAVSPLRSPMLAAGASATAASTGGLINGSNSTSSGLASLTSLGGGLGSPNSSVGPISPTGSTTSSSNASSVLGPDYPPSNGARLRTSSPTRSEVSSISSNSRFRSHSPPSMPLMLSQTSVHTKMPPMFHSVSSPTSSLATTPTPSSTNGNGKMSWPSMIKEPIQIPVQHIGSSLSKEEAGLRSPSVLNTLRQPSFPKDSIDTTDNMQRRETLSIRPTLARRDSPELDMGKATLPIANMHLAHVDHMKKRFEEAKQRMNLIHERALIGHPPPTHFVDKSTEDLLGFDGNGFDDPSSHSSFLFDQFRRRIAAKNKQQASLPHPELTPQQRQHIFERSAPGNNSLLGATQLPRRIGGSVAERVMIFERCPVFNPADPAKDGRLVGTGGFPPGSLSTLNDKKKELTPLQINTGWKSQPIDSQAPKSKVRDIPIAQTGLPASTTFTGNLLNSSTPSSPAASSTSGQLTSPLLLSSATSSPPSSVAAPLSTAATPPGPTSLFTTSPFSASTVAPAASSFSTTSSPTTASSHPASRPTSLISPSPPASAISSRVASPQPKSRPTSLVITAKDKVLPKFHFPNGDPSMSLSSEIPLSRFFEEFRKYKNSTVVIEELGQILKACGYPVYWKGVVFVAAAGDKGSTLSYLQFADFWRRLITSHHDEASQFVFVLAKGNAGKKFLVPEDFVPLIQDIVDTHPGLGFLKEATEFHSRYVHTVIARIFFVVNRSWSGHISIPELRRSNFLATLRILDQEEDINQITDFFSYEHFYVIYCKFWELDKDHDLFIDREDLSRHNDHAISTRMIDRIFSGAVTRGVAQQEGKMSYTEFVWFLLAEEDKRSPTSIEYWFRCMDLDGDGYLSMYELEYFYEEQLQRMEQLGIETLPFEDCLCQMLDMISPKERTKISLSDLKNCRMTPIFFDTFFNLEKYLDHEQRDPFASQHDVDEDGNEMSDWDRFAAEEYELLVAEEGNAEAMDDMCYDDDINPEMQMEAALEKDGSIYREPLMTVSSS